MRKKGLPHEVLNYKDIEAVYNTVVITRTNPVSGKPVVFLVSEDARNITGQLLNVDGGFYMP